MLVRKDPEMELCWFVRQDLSVQQGFLLYQTRFLIPAVLQKDLLDRLHEGYQGIKC